MKKDGKILEQIGGKTGYKVPEGYFEQFAARMTEQLPEREIPMPEVVSTWKRISPYLYMAAMFAGVWLMVQMFVSPSAQQHQEEQAVAAVEADFEEYLLYSVDDYVLFETLYADSETY